MCQPSHSKLKPALHLNLCQEATAEKEPFFAVEKLNLRPDLMLGLNGALRWKEGHILQTTDVPRMYQPSHSILAPALHLNLRQEATAIGSNFFAVDELNLRLNLRGLSTIL